MGANISVTSAADNLVPQWDGAKCCASHAPGVTVVTDARRPSRYYVSAGRSPAFSLARIEMEGFPGAPPGRGQTDWEAGMLWTIFVILLVLWLLGMVSSYTFGGFIHILLVIALAIVLIRVIQGRRPV